MDEDGYLLLRHAIEPDRAMTARDAILERLARVDEIHPPPAAGVPTGRSARPTEEPARGAFWKSVSEEPALRAVTHGGALGTEIARIIGTPMRPHDYLFLRVAVAGRATSLHCDYPFFTRATERVWTSWIALGPVSRDQGPVFVVEGSHRFADHVAGMTGFDLERAQGRRRATLADCPIAFAEERGARLLTACFEPGDVLLFGMFLMHGAFDHTAEGGTVRVTCDVRWQPTADRKDPRYFVPREEPGRD